MKALWSRLLVVGIGEVPDGAFPSLAVAATELMFEDAWNARADVPSGDRAKLDEVLARSPAFAKELARSVKAVGDATASAARTSDDLL
jgi:hypothetical protein